MYLSQGYTSKQLLGFIDVTVRPATHQRDTNTMDTKKYIQSSSNQWQLQMDSLQICMAQWRDSGMLADSNLLNSLRQHSIDSNGNPLCIYGDPAYLLRVGCADYRLTARLE